MATANSKLVIDFGFESRGTSNVQGDMDITGSLSVGGNLAFSGTTLGNFIPDQDQRSLGNTVNRWNLQGYTANIASTLTVAGVTTLQEPVTLSKTLSSGNTTVIGFANVTTSVNSALLTVGSSFIANTTGAYHTGTINAASFTTSSIVSNTIAIVPTSNTILLGNTTGRFVLSANSGNFSGDVTIAGNTIINNATLNGTLQTISGNVNFDSGILFVDATNNRVGIANTTPQVALEVSGSANVSVSVNTSLLTVGSSFIANTTGAYHTGVVNAASHTTSGFVANTTAIVPTSNTILLGNTTGRFVLSANTGSFSGAVSGITTLDTGNTTVTGFVNSTSTVNAATLSVGTSFIANATQVTVAAGVRLSANGSTGTAGHALYSNGSTGSPYWSTAVTSVGSGNGLSGGPVTTTGTLSVAAGSGIASNSSGVHVVAGSGIASNSTGTHVVAGSGIISNSSGVFVNASSIAVGTVPTARLGTGTAIATTYLAGDQSYKTITADARAAVSFTAGSGAYNSSTGVFTIPTNTNQLTNGAGYITGITSGNVTTALGFTPYNSTNPSGYISSVPNASTQVTSLGVGTAASGTTGEIRANNNITAYYSSDRKFKENIQSIENALSKVCSIGGKTFDWTDNYISSHGGEDGYFIRKSDFGVIAQDVQSVFPVAVRERGDGSLAVDYEKLSSLAFAAIVELKNEIDDLRIQINEIKNGN